VRQGDADLERAVALLDARLPGPLQPLASLAYNYFWTWTPGAEEVFAAIDPVRWDGCDHNPVRLLSEAPVAVLEDAASRDPIVRAAQDLGSMLETELARPAAPGPVTPAQPVAFFCAEFAVHVSLPIYSGGLGVLAGDVLKQASDLALPVVGVGLLYRTGYFHQRLDLSGLQHEYWVEVDPDRLPLVPVTAQDDQRLRVSIPIYGEDVLAQVWRVDVGRVPLYLLDTDVPGNSAVARWVTSRLYEGNPEVRLAQYAVLGVGGVRALRAMGIEPAVFHLNEGHAALAAVELATERLAAGAPADAVWPAVREDLVFTTHTPVAAGNETYAPAELIGVLGRLLRGAGDPAGVIGLGQLDSSDPGCRFGLSTLAVRAAHSVNGVSARHGGVARAMWAVCWPGHAVDDVPITHVTNGVHVPTWLVPPVRDLMLAALGPTWARDADDPAAWAALAGLPDEQLWAARQEARRRLVVLAAAHSTRDRLGRGEGLTYSAAAEHGLRPDVLTIGFARRLASYKRFHLLAAEPERAVSLLRGERAVQLLLAGKAHPRDEEAKQGLQLLFGLKGAPEVAGRVAVLEDYDLELARALVAGCDVWVNLPRSPLEASGTSGMKAALNGVLNLSVLDGWWPEAYDGTNGWAIDGAVSEDFVAQDERDGRALYDLIEHDVVPLFHDRDEAGIPRRWVAMIKRSLQTIGPLVAGGRMLREYRDRVYFPAGGSP
jgi:starch phosphorylase